MGAYSTSSGKSSYETSPRQKRPRRAARSMSPNPQEFSPRAPPNSQQSTPSPRRRVPMNPRAKLANRAATPCPDHEQNKAFRGENNYKKPRKIDYEYYLNQVELDKKNGTWVPPTTTSGTSSKDLNFQIQMTDDHRVILTVLSMRCSWVSNSPHICWADENDRDMFN